MSHDVFPSAESRRLSSIEYWRAQKVHAEDWLKRHREDVSPALEDSFERHLAKAKKKLADLEKG